MERNQIDPSAIVHANARIGRGNVIGAYVYIGQDVILGDDNIIRHGAHLGIEGEMRGHPIHKGKLKIGGGNVIGENAVIKKGFGGTTKIGNKCIIMSFVNIGHDCQIGNEVEIGAGTIVSGLVKIGDKTQVKVHCTIRNRVEIGKSCLIGMGSNVVSNVYDREQVYGNPAKTDA